MTETERPHLLTIPPELREEIYKLILHPDANRKHFEDEYSDYDFGPALVLFRINRQICLESRKVFRDLNTFVRIETPWPEVQNLAAMEGHVPIVITRDKTLEFNDHSLTVAIDAPEYMAMYAAQWFIILAEDLPKFTRMWFYRNLSYDEGLNPRRRLKLLLRDPYSPSWEEKHMPKWLQRKLLMPFGEIKGLHSMEVGGDIKAFGTIEKELREMQVQPRLSPEQCLREATRLKFAGNDELKEKRYEDALKLYTEAWAAMHIVVKGRQRHIHGDQFFHHILTEEPYKGKSGSVERLLLRIHLVANTCQVYLKMENYELCQFWGLRTIHMLRQERVNDPRETLTPEEEAVLGLPAADQMGKIYYRTAVACKMLEDESEARKLLRVAQVYLPRNQDVKREIAATALQIG